MISGLLFPDAGSHVFTELGPALGALGVAGSMADPQLKIFNRAGVQLALNDDSGGTAELKTAFTQLGAANLASDTSKDAALLITLPPGIYSPQVSGVNNTTGVALVEIYVVP